MSTDESTQPSPEPVRTWPAIKAAYVSHEGSLRALAARFGVSLNTLEKRAAREGWRQEMAALDGKVTAAAVEMAVERGRARGLTAAAFVERTIKETEDWLDQIRALAVPGAVNVESLSKLVRPWQEVVDTGRKLFGLDKSEANVQVNVLSNRERRPVRENGDAPISVSDDDSES